MEGRGGRRYPPEYKEQTEQIIPWVMLLPPLTRHCPKGERGHRPIPSRSRSRSTSCSNGSVGRILAWRMGPTTTFRCGNGPESGYAPDRMIICKFQLYLD